jgi:hypothetical protein
MPVATKKSSVTPTMTPRIRLRRARVQLCSCSMTTWVFAGAASDASGRRSRIAFGTIIIQIDAGLAGNESWSVPLLS